MLGNKSVLFFFGLALVPDGYAGTFRNCETEDSEAWVAATRYTVGELAFDATTGLASGTETIYNYSNAYGNETGECHVTYELNGSYVPGVEVFVLSATRSNYSESCPAALLRVEYPSDLLLSLQVEPGADGAAVVSSADSGAYLADGSWSPGRAVFKTGEQCSLF